MCKAPPLEHDKVAAADLGDTHTRARNVRTCSERLARNGPRPSGLLRLARPKPHSLGGGTPRACVPVLWPVELGLCNRRRRRSNLVACRAPNPLLCSLGGRASGGHVRAEPDLICAELAAARHHSGRASEWFDRRPSPLRGRRPASKQASRTEAVLRASRRGSASWGRVGRAARDWRCRCRAHRPSLLAARAT